MNVPLVDLKAQYLTIKPEVDAAISRVLDNTTFILGEEVSAFEKSFAEYVGAKFGVGVGCGTSALQLALLASGIGRGDEVITVAHTFTATAEAILHAGAKPVFVDIDPRTYCIDPSRVEDAISSRTKAIIPVHLYGHPAEMDPILDIANRRGLLIIEDAAQAHGAEYDSIRCGSIGNLACFSFYPGKNLGAYGDAGIVTGNDEKLISRVRRLRDHGRTNKYEHDEIGFCERMDAIQAAVLRVKLDYLEDWTEARRKHASYYNSLLDQTDVITPYASPSVRHVYHLYVVRVSKRDKLAANLKAKGISAGIHYPIPLHYQPAYMKIDHGNRSLPDTEMVASQILSLPMYPKLTADKIDYVVEMLKLAMRQQ